MVVRCLCLLIFLSAAVSGADTKPKKPPFDFAAAERLADQQLKRPATPAEKPPAPVPPIKPAQPLCNACKGTLLAACPQHAKQAAYVSDTPNDPQICKVCSGAGVLACPTCKNKKDLADQWKQAEDTSKQIVEDLRTSIKDMHALAEGGKLGYKLSGHAAPHVVIGSTLDRKSILPCVHHAEGAIAKLNEAFTRPEGTKTTFDFLKAQDTRFFIVNTQAEYKPFVENIVKVQSPSIDVDLTLKLSGTHRFYPPSLSLTCFEKLARREDTLQHSVVHQLGHFAVNRLAGSRSLPTWIEEGFAAQVETMEMGQPVIYCCDYQENRLDVLRTRDAALKRLSQKPIPMEKLVRITYLDMKADEYFQAWSLVTMLIERDSDKFQAFLKALPKGERDPGGLRIDAAEQEAALKEAYGYDYPKLLAVWRMWLATR
ncbi:MAG TPA: DUF1570 domain-containing protein [Planctomycetota bacterium]|nr:DUF1570 domain-containing protein [Planctomycetota bacterium]